jgi:hypothetical protein
MCELNYRKRPEKLFEHAVVARHHCERDEGLRGGASESIYTPITNAHRLLNDHDRAAEPNAAVPDR